MRKVTEELRLRFGLGLCQSQIARSCSIGQATVHRYLERAQAAGISWPLPEGCDENRLQQLLYGRILPEPVGAGPTRPAPDFPSIHRQLKSSKHVTLQLLWQEYREQHPGGYLYSCFCELYGRWRRNQSVVLRHDHKAGEKTFVDWAGPGIPIYDRITGEAPTASLFVAVLGASSYTFARATLSQNLAQWIDCHTLAFEFFGGNDKTRSPGFCSRAQTRTVSPRVLHRSGEMEIARRYGCGTGSVASSGIPVRRTRSVTEELHGGPTEVTLDAFPGYSTYPVQAFLQNGFTVFSPNSAAP